MTVRKSGFFGHPAEGPLSDEFKKAIEGWRTVYGLRYDPACFEKYVASFALESDRTEIMAASRPTNEEPTAAFSTTFGRPYAQCFGCAKWEVDKSFEEISFVLPPRPEE